MIKHLRKYHINKISKFQKDDAFYDMLNLIRDLVLTKSSICITGVKFDEASPFITDLLELVYSELDEQTPNMTPISASFVDLKNLWDQHFSQHDYTIWNLDNSNKYQVDVFKAATKLCVPLIYSIKQGINSKLFVDPADLDLACAINSSLAQNPHEYINRPHFEIYLRKSDDTVQLVGLAETVTLLGRYRRSRLLFDFVDGVDEYVREYDVSEYTSKYIKRKLELLSHQNKIDELSLVEAKLSDVCNEISFIRCYV